jgi:hypothetical protein
MLLSFWDRNQVRSQQYGCRHTTQWLPNHPHLWKLFFEVRANLQQGSFSWEVRAESSTLDWLQFMSNFDLAIESVYSYCKKYDWPGSRSMCLKFFWCLGRSTAVAAIILHEEWLKAKNRYLISSSNIVATIILRKEWLKAYHRAVVPYPCWSQPLFFMRSGWKL